jgi:hypothetical protein
MIHSSPCRQYVNQTVVSFMETERVVICLAMSMNNVPSHARILSVGTYTWRGPHVTYADQGPKVLVTDYRRPSRLIDAQRSHRDNDDCVSTLPGSAIVTTSAEISYPMIVGVYAVDADMYAILEWLTSGLSVCVVFLRGEMARHIKC